MHVECVSHVHFSFFIRRTMSDGREFHPARESLPRGQVPAPRSVEAAKKQMISGSPGTHDSLARSFRVSMLGERGLKKSSQGIIIFFVLAVYFQLRRQITGLSDPWDHALLSSRLLFYPEPRELAFSVIKLTSNRDTKNRRRIG